MNKKIAILRGINVGGKRKILMAELRSLCENLGWQNVQSYIQSGNLIFDSETQNSELESALHQAIFERYGFDVPVILRNANDLQNSIRRNPYYGTGADISQLHLTFLKEKPTDENIAHAKNYNPAPDKFEINEKNVFLCCAGKSPI